MAGDEDVLTAALAEFVQVFDDVCDSNPGRLGSAGTLSRVLNGQASTEVRRLVPLDERRRLGAFFTPHELADKLADPLRRVQGQVTVLDPCCGAGDLLLAAARALEDPVRRGDASAELAGVEIVNEFSRVALMRFELLLQTLELNVAGRFSVADGLTAPDLDKATHLLLNPPFAAVTSDESCRWAGGRVNGAADFLARTVVRLKEGVEVHAILPDVLRSGSRYRRWRNFIAERLDLDTPEPTGRFDPWTDIDVFILRGLTRDVTTGAPPHEWGPSTAGSTVGDRFDVSVGPLVDYRSPLQGPHVPYLVAKGFPVWGTITAVERTRRFSGRLHQGPIVVIPRTSRPGDPYRARAAVVADPRAIAVENHLLVLRPKHGGLAECRRLLRQLRSEQVNDWLDQVIRCRHLTVSAVTSIPWSPDRDRVR